MISAKKNGRRQRRQLQEEVHESAIKIGKNDLLPVFTSVLKLSGSIKAEIVPGSPDNFEKKAYDWQVGSFNEKGIEIKFNFENPEYISFGEADTMRLTYNNMDQLMAPKDTDKQNIPNGYVDVFKIPPQSKDAKSAEEIES